MTREEYAKLEKEFEQLMATPIPRAKPKPPPKVVAAVSDRMNAAVKANPESVRVVAKTDDGVTLVERPRVLERLEVTEVDAKGRPKLARCYDVATNSWGMVEFKDGYRQPNAAVHEYDPLSALNRD